MPVHRGHMTLAEDLKPLIADFIHHYENRGQKSEADCFRWGLPYFLRFMSSQRSHIQSLSDLARRDIDLFLSYLWSVEYGDHMASAYLYRDGFVYRCLRSLYKFFEYIIIHEDTISVRHLPGRDLIHKADFPQPNKRGVKHFPAWFDKHLLNCLREMKENTSKRLVLKAMIMCLYHLGARASDVCTLERDCFITKLGFTWMRIFSNKTKTYYEIPITQELKNILDKVLETTPGYPCSHPTQHTMTTFMFGAISDLETSRRKFSFRVKRFMEDVKDAAAEKNLPIRSLAALSLTTHKFRHTVAIRLIRLGADPMLVAEFLGHKDLSMAQAYIQESEQEIDAIMNELWDDDSLELEKDLLDGIEVSREDIMRFKGPVTKTECGWCTHLNGEPPCGEDPYGCWLCDELKPDLDNPEYLDRLTIHLLDHQTLLERNQQRGFLGAAKTEEKIIAKINGFIAEVHAKGVC